MIFDAACSYDAMQIGSRFFLAPLKIKFSDNAPNHPSVQVFIDAAKHKNVAQPPSSASQTLLKYRQIPYRALVAFL